jgi:hypothetical protein
MVVVFTILFENAAKVVLIQDQDRVQTLFANRTHPPFSESIRPGGLIGVWTKTIPSEENTVSKDEGNFLSLSWMRKALS